MNRIIIIGAGLAGLTSALTLAENGEKCLLVSATPSERAQSNLAAGGINAANEDQVSLMEDTQTAGEYLGNFDAVRELASHADETLEWLKKQGVPFQMKDGKTALRKMGGHAQKRTCYAGSITGKAIMAALIDQVRRYEAEGVIERKSHHILEDLIVNQEKQCLGCIIRDRYTGKTDRFQGRVILASGGMSGLFPGHGTGVRENDADVTAIAFMRGVRLGNLEFIQYHPTTIAIPGKQCLISEAARSAGGRIFTERKGVPWYFLEDEYGKGGNLLCRDKIVKEFWKVRKREDVSGEIFLDMREIPDAVWDEELICLRDLCKAYLEKDPKYTPIPIQEGMHYFMGGILTDKTHRTSMAGVYAAGECACIYHGANRLGGNPLLGAVYGGKTAALSAISEGKNNDEIKAKMFDNCEAFPEYKEKEAVCIAAKIGDILYDAMGAVRTKERLQRGYQFLEELQDKTMCSEKQKRKILLGKAMIQSALERKESRGAHIREDFPEIQKTYQRTSVVEYRNGEILLSYQEP